MQNIRPALKNLPPAIALLPQRHQRIALALGAIVLGFAVYNMWFALGSHPLYSPDEGRYARVSQVMGETGNYLVPMFENRPRLNKPPLIHWLAVASMTLLGQTQFAVRLPSVLAMMLACGSVYWMGTKMRDAYTGLVAAVLLLVAPLVVVVGRMVLIDPLLDGFWTAAMACGYMAFAVEGAIRNRKSAIPNRKYLLLFYLWVTLAMFAKGPQGLVPMAVVLIWLMVQGRWRQVFHWHWLVGLIVVGLPLLAWAGAVWAKYPQAAATWQKEIVARATGEGGDHPRPWWYYLPLVIGGFFPLTVMLPLPGMHTPRNRIIENFRRGHVVGYLIIAAIVPLIIYSAMVGKLVTYILPMAGPLALIAAWYVRNWLDVTDDRKVIRATPGHPARRIPDGLGSITIALLVIVIGGIAALSIPRIKAMIPLDPQILPGLMRVLLQSMIVPAGLIVAIVLFNKGATRIWGLIVAGAALVIAINIALNVESSLSSRGPVPQLLAKIHEDCAADSPAGVTIHTLGFRDTSLSFYADRYIARLDEVEWQFKADPPSIADYPRPDDAKGKAWVIITEPDYWRGIEKAAPRFAARFQQIETWPRPVGQWLVLVSR